MNKPSKFKEYFNLYKHGLSEIDKVLASRWNGALQSLNMLSPDKQAVAEHRLAICESCPFMSTNAQWPGTGEEYKNFHGFYYATNRVEEHCTSCGCGIEARTLSMDSDCGNSHWNSEHPNKTLPVKWDVYRG